MANSSEEPASKKQKTDDNQFTQLSKLSVIVADTGDLSQIQKFKPQDATTNPSLIYKAAMMKEYAEIVQTSIKDGGNSGIPKVMDNLAVNFGVEITKIVPGYVSTEVDARLSFDTEGTIEKAKSLIELYEKKGISKDRILIKIAATWEGIQAAKVLENECGIKCNLTLVFSLTQAIACAKANVTLISPFVGRIMDWYKKNEGWNGSAETDPGVMSVTQIYNYFKNFGYKTIVMGASFRNTGEILELAGCDRLTIAPSFLSELSTNTTDKVNEKLTEEKAKAAFEEDEKEMEMNEKIFRWNMNQDAMATEKLAEGIRNFTKDIIKLEAIIRDTMALKEVQSKDSNGTK